MQETGEIEVWPKTLLQFQDFESNTPGHSSSGFGAQILLMFVSWLPSYAEIRPSRLIASSTLCHVPRSRVDSASSKLLA